MAVQSLDQIFAPTTPTSASIASSVPSRQPQQSLDDIFKPQQSAPKQSIESIFNPAPKGPVDMLSDTPEAAKEREATSLSSVMAKSPTVSKLNKVGNEMGSNMSNEEMAGVNQVKEGIAGGADKYSQGVSEANNSNNLGDEALGEIKATGGLVDSAAQSVIGAGRAIFAPATAAIKTFINHASDIPAIQKLTQTPAIKSWLDSADASAASIEKLAQDHPTFARIVENVLGVGALALGGGAEGSIEPSVMESLKGMTSDITSGMKTATGAVKGALIPEPSAGTIKTPAPDSSLQESIRNTMPLQEKSTRISELQNALPGDKNTGGVSRKGVLGDVTPNPSDADIKVGTEAHPYIKGVKDPLTRIQNVNQGIKDSSNELDSFLDSNKTNANLEDIRNYLQTNKPTFSLKGDTGANEAYSRATENAVNTIADVLKSEADKSGDFGPSMSGSTIRKARIAVDNQINQQLGESVFGSPQYNGIKAAAVDSRNLINRMNEDMLRYPGQLENVNRMNEFMSEAKSRGIDVDIKDPKVKADIESRFGLKSTPESEANAQRLEQTHKKMANLFSARDNMIDNFQNQIGKNKLSAWIKANPVKAKAIGLGATALGIGHFAHILP